MNIPVYNYSEEKMDTIKKASRALIFTQEMDELYKNRITTINKLKDDSLIQLVNNTFDNEERKLREKWGVRHYERHGNHGYGRLPPLSKVEKRYEMPSGKPIEEYIEEIQKTTNQKQKLTAQEASDLYLTYDEWKCDLTKAPDWVYNQGMGEENNPERK